VPLVSAESTELFVGPPDAPLQLVRVTYHGRRAARLAVEGDGLRTPEPVLAEPASTVEVPVLVGGPVPGGRRAARIVGQGVSVPFTFTVAEPGWTMFMISHFHYDPVWWNTQGAYTSMWSDDPPGRQTNGLDLVRTHLETARRDPDYRFVLAEVDYLKPYWDTHPEDRADLRRFIAAGRVEVMGGAYNEPNTNLTSPETTIRNLVAGSGFQRDILGADPSTAWQLDVFGHDPQFPGMAAAAGLTSSSWARGPHHQWGPMAGSGDPTRMQFASEFEWISPSGLGLLTHYMPAHYGAGWGLDEAATLADAELAAYRLFLALKKVAATRNVLLPVGTDYTPPNKWVTDIHRDWNARYTWPRFVSALPREFFAAVRAELAARGRVPSPQTRDMNPVYTGKDVSYIDTKQANRDAENAVLDAERFAVFARLLAGAEYPQAALAKAWVELAYGAHHDAITGSESDQVYLDLLTGWRDAWQLGRTARDNALELLSSAVEGTVAVWNSLSHKRTDIVTVCLDPPVGPGVRVLDADDNEVPALVERGGRCVSWLARDVPSLGWRGYRLSDERSREEPKAIAAGRDAGWQPLPGNEIRNEHYRLRADPVRGGGVASLLDLATGRELIADRRVGNELAVYDEYPAHPTGGEGPWHLLPSGPVVGSSATPAKVRAYRSAVGSRLVVEGGIGKLLRYKQTLTLWHGIPRVDCQTVIDDFTGADHLVRLRWPCPVPGALPVSEVGDAVVGRGFGLLHDGPQRSVDTASHPWTLDNPAYTWFGLSSTARIRVGEQVRAMAVAEIVVPTEAAFPHIRDVMVGLVRTGVTATCSGAELPRYGDLDVDSNLPDTRIAVGGPDENPFAAAVLAEADPVYADELNRQMHATGEARVWVPAAAPLAQAWVPGADLRNPRALPVLIVAGTGAVDSLADDLADAEIVVRQRVPADMEPFEPRTVAVLNRGVPGFAVDTEGTLHMSLMRSCTGWPSGVWTDEPRRTAPDGSNFQLQHWTHTFDYAIIAAAGDWRRADVPARGAEFSRPLRAVLTGGAGAGGLGAVGSLLEVAPYGASAATGEHRAGVQIAAVKAAGNPLARGSVQPVDPAAAVALRLVETQGAATRVAVSSAVGAVSPLAMADLLERPGEPIASGTLTLHGYQIATILARFDVPPRIDAAGARLAPDAEAAQPLYARYWLHNRGPAPLGGLPAVAHLHPHRVAAENETHVSLRLTVCSDCTDASLTGVVRLVVPDGWVATHRELRFELSAGGYCETEIGLTMPAGTSAGLYPLRAQLELTGAGLPPAWRQIVEDVCLVCVGTPTANELLRLISGPEPVEVAPGGRALLSVIVGTDARADMALEAHLISPWGTWDWLVPSVRGAVLPAGGKVELNFDVCPPAWVEPGRWWALVRVACAGRLLYSPAVPVGVR
jgi:alpha-mannosidase